MEFREWNLLSFLNNPIQPSLSFGSGTLSINPSFIILCGLGFILLSLFYLVGMLSAPTRGKVQYSNKHQGRAQRRKRGGSLKACSYYPTEEEEEEQQLIALLKSHQGQNYNITCFHQLLCPDPFCQVCNTTTVEVSRLLCPEVLEGQETPELLHLIPLSLPEKHPQPQLQVLPQAQSPPVSHGQTQAHLPSRPRIPPSGPLSKMRICEVCFRGPQNDLDSLTHLKFKSRNGMCCRSNRNVRGVYPLWSKDLSILSLLPHLWPKKDETLRRSPPNINHEIAKDIQGIKEARQTLGHVIHGIKGQATHSQTLPANRSLSELPPKQVGPLYERECKTVRCSNEVEMQHGKKTEKILKPVSELSMSRNVFRAAEVDTLQGQISDILTTRKPGSSQMKNVNGSVTTEHHPQNILGPRDLKSKDLRQQLLNVLMVKFDSETHAQAEGQPTHMSLASDGLMSTASLTHAQGISSGDMGPFQKLHVHVEDRGSSMEHQQEPRVPKRILRKCLGGNFPPGAKKASPPGSTAKGPGGRDAGLGTSQSGKKSSPARETLGRKSSQTLSQKAQPAKSRFCQTMKHFFK